MEVTADGNTGPPCCWSHITANAILITLLVISVMKDVVLFYRWKIQKRRKRASCRRNLEKFGMINIGMQRYSCRDSKTTVTSSCNKKIRESPPCIDELREESRQKVIIPSINIIDKNGDAFPVSAPDKACTRLHTTTNFFPERDVPIGSTCSCEASGEYADLLTESNVTKQSRAAKTGSNETKPFDSSTPNPNTTIKKIPSHELTYISPVCFVHRICSRNELLISVRHLQTSEQDFPPRSGQNVSEALQKEENAGVHSRIASVLRSIPTQLSSTISALGNSFPTSLPANPLNKLTLTPQDAVYFSFNDLPQVNGEHNASPVVKRN